MTWSERIIAAHLEVTEAVSHSERLKSSRYFVWQEDGANDLTANNGHGERVMTGRTDLYTKAELDPWADALGEALTGQGVAWTLISAEYEPETGLYHWSWDWEV